MVVALVTQKKTSVEDGKEGKRVGRNPQETRGDSDGAFLR